MFFTDSQSKPNFNNMDMEFNIKDETQAIRFLATAFAYLGQSEARILVKDTNEEITLDFFDTATQERILDFWAMQETHNENNDGRTYSFKEITAFLFPQNPIVTAQITMTKQQFDVCSIEGKPNSILTKTPL